MRANLIATGLPGLQAAPVLAVKDELVRSELNGLPESFHERIEGLPQRLPKHKRNHVTAIILKRASWTRKDLQGMRSERIK